MKKYIFTLGLIFALTCQLFAQTDGITYQAVIIGPDAQELPGVDAQNNILPNTKITIRFTIMDANNGVEYQEVQTTKTDQYGRINLLIGAVNPDGFKRISWDGTNKDLKVEIDFKGGSSYVDLSREQLTFLPFALHRNIHATGTLTVDDATFLNSELTVQGPTNLNSTLDVNNHNETNLSGVLNVEGQTYLSDSLSVLNKANTFLSGNLTVKGEANFADIKTDYLIVEKTTKLNDQVTITIDPDDTALTDPLNDDNFGAYALQVNTRSQGIAIKVEGSRSNNTNFISFWDSTDGGKMWGRIEGERWIDSDGDGELDDDEGEFKNDNDFNDDIRSLDYDIRDAWLDASFQTYDIIKEIASLNAAVSDVRACFGFGACVTSPSFSQIATAVGNIAIELVKEGFVIENLDRAYRYKNLYLEKRRDLEGVTYQSGAGDYAEYLIRENIGEKIGHGDIVGVKGGKISKNTNGAERMMVISKKPIVLGNMPQPNKETEYEKVAFMGQVPVKVFGKVNIGDYIIPSGKNDGIGIAISSSEITSKDIKKIVGIAWTSTDNIFGFNMINMAVGLNTNDNNPMIEKLEMKVQEQAVEITNLKGELEHLINRVVMIEQGTSNSAITKSANQEEVSKKGEVNGRKYEIEDTPQGEIIYWELTKVDFENGLVMAENNLRDEGIDLENNEFWKQIKTDPDFKTELFNKLQKKLDKQFHYHKEIDKKGMN